MHVFHDELAENNKKTLNLLHHLSQLFKIIRTFDC